MNFEYAESGVEQMVKFQEAASTGDFPSLMREDYKDMLLSSYSQMPSALFPLCYVVDSNKETETYRGLKDLGPTTDVVPEGGEFPERMLGAKDVVTISNRKTGDLVSYTREMSLYNKLSEFKRLTELQGNALGAGLEENIADCIETSGNYTAYGSSLALNRANLELMIIKFNTQTATDAEGKTVRGLYKADTLVVPPDLEFEARRLLQSPSIPGSANNDVNVLQGGLNLVIAPTLASTSIYYLMKAKSPVGLIYQKVIGPPPETFIQDIKSSQVSDNVFRYDKISFRADMIYGLGVLDAKMILKSYSS